MKIKHQHKLKYLKLFEGISQSDIPYSYYDDSYTKLNIYVSPDIKELPKIYNELTDEITGYLEIENNQELTHITGFDNLTIINDNLKIYFNPNLTHITGFNNLTEIHGNLDIQNNQELKYITGFNNLTRIWGWLPIINNPNLVYITGFNNLTKISDRLYLRGNSKLILISIPHTLIKSTYFDYTNNQNMYFNSYPGNQTYRLPEPKKFINYPDTIQDCIYKFNPTIHPDVVVKQIIENLEIWGEPDTIKTIINHILSKGDYWKYIPESFKQYVEEKYIHLYNAIYANTGARSIAKMTTGRYLGTF